MNHRIDLPPRGECGHARSGRQYNMRMQAYASYPFRCRHTMPFQVSTGHTKHQVLQSRHWISMKQVNRRKGNHMDAELDPPWNRLVSQVRLLLPEQ